MRSKLTGMLAGIAMTLASGTASRERFISWGGRARRLSVPRRSWRRRRNLRRHGCCLPNWPSRKASGTAAYSQELTIFWAEWDPANYLQELANEYEKETGVKVTVETTPWPDFQTKAFTEFNAKGSAYDMVVGDSQWIGAASEAGHYVDLSEFFAKHKLTETMAPATVKYYAEYPAASGKYWSVQPSASR